MDVAVRELKAKLSSYLQRAAAGERITVTDRGRPIATLGPVVDGVDVSVGVAEGWVTPASSTGLTPVRRAKAETTVLQALAEDRSE